MSYGYQHVPLLAMDQMDQMDQTDQTALWSEAFELTYSDDPFLDTTAVRRRPPPPSDFMPSSPAGDNGQSDAWDWNIGQQYVPDDDPAQRHQSSASDGPQGAAGCETITISREEFDSVRQAAKLGYAEGVAT